LGVADLRTLFILGRVSNLPTVWSNCVAGWILGGGGRLGSLLWLCFGATFLYLGGTYLNDAFDFQFDAQHRPDRPIPSGQVTVEAVWLWGLGWLGLGLFDLSLLGKATGTFAALLAVSILIYDAIHKIFAFSPVFMAACRSFLVLAAASVGREGVTGLAIWSALALGAYVFGLSYLARKESIKTRVRYWPLLPLAAPMVLALVVNQGESQLRASLLGSLLVVWLLNSLRHTLWTDQRNIKRTVNGLLAGIVLVDLLAIAGGGMLTAASLAVLFLLAVGLQRFVPAT
jgi:hypothetical protein